MDERAARDVVLVHALETTHPDAPLLRSDESRQAGISARNMGTLGRARQADAADAFLHTRAVLLLDVLERRLPALGAVRRPYPLGRTAGWIVPIAGLLAGALTERIANPHRLDLLSLPLLAVLGWNLLMYAALLAAWLMPGARRIALRKMRGWHAPSWLRRRPPATLAAALARFAGEWQRLSAPLTVARSKRMLHLAAALFGAGIALSLYARGLFVEYRVGWESTFLSAPQVHALLEALFAPAGWLFGVAPPTLEQVQAMRFGAADGVADGARWVHAYAALLAVVVVAPRLLLAAWARWRETRLHAAFPLDLSQPYYRRLLGALSPVPLRMLVLPYSYALDETRTQALQGVARAQLGDTAQAVILPSCDYGADPDEAPGLDAASEPPTLAAALFSLAATPEQDAHGRFVAHLAQALPGRLILLIDASGYASRLAGQADAGRRLAERQRLWQDFADLYRVPARFTDLLPPPADAR
ncbi:hypothetical protein PIGHUM_03103 [Pigmentiphaga humi]|uniref:DUF2868 domain-containing protein n=1 Tax=Pigmentiphaga humi TaxID=2478468 RepID=A0A3P4B406_9BURK|nr:DUF2868 domain-containing protein [Pigmentiphaga humi]VCU71023.1 hypothetical protein PIGHUM_03103 [Pigmentiphaga humi]